jgi:hypothetical protein
MFALAPKSPILGTALAAGESWCAQGYSVYGVGADLAGRDLCADGRTPKHESPVSIRNFAGPSQEMGT